MHPEPKTPWLVVCSCGWTREASSQWAANSVSKPHRQLGSSGEHVTRLWGPGDSAGERRLSLTWRSRLSGRRPRSSAFARGGGPPSRDHAEPQEQTVGYTPGRWRNAGPLVHPCAFGYHSRAMLSRAQEARVRDILGNHPPGIIQTYCLEHLAAAVKIPPGHLADLAAFVRSLREQSVCQTRYGGTCDTDGHETDRALIWGPPTLMMPAETGGGHAA